MKFVLPQSYIDEGLVRVAVHPSLPLRIYSYTEHCQFDKKWDDVTLQCRGLVVDAEDNIVARPFKKFFNYEEHQGEFPKGTPEIIEKVDGSLGILFWYADQWHLATRGSFASEQAVHGQCTLRDKYGVEIAGWPRHYTHLFEIIYPQNRIVVNYGATDDLVYLGSVETDSGVESSDFIAITGSPFKQPNSLGFAAPDYVRLKSLESGNAEGFVLRWPSGFRLKIKFEEYKRLHRILTNTTERTVWEALKEGKDVMQIAESVPDEFHQWLSTVVNGLVDRHQKIKMDMQEIFAHCKDFAEDDRKQFASMALVYGSPWVGMLFSLYDGRSIDKAVWDSIKPSASKPFVNEN